MRIKQLRLRQYRNLANTTVDLHPVLNVIHGRNAQGKTNFLEAIYVIASLKSFRHGKNADLIRWQEEDAIIQSIVERRDIVRDVRVHIRPGRKTIHIDGKHARSLQESFGHVNVVLFSPEDLAISKGSPSNRRTFIDRAIFNMIPAYFAETRAYEKALKSRNALLRGNAGSGIDKTMLSVFDREVIVSGSRIVRRRSEFIKIFNPKAREIHSELCSGQQDIDFSYESNLGIDEVNLSEDHIQNVFEEAMRASVSRDMLRGATSCGPHADNLGIVLDGRPARIHASQGQHRSIVLGMKIAEISLIEDAIEVRPILLLDDVSSELDRYRNEQLMEYLNRSQGQVIVTTTDPDYIARTDALHLELEDGILQIREGAS